MANIYNKFKMPERFPVNWSSSEKKKIDEPAQEKSEPKPDVRKKDEENRVYCVEDRENGRTKDNDSDSVFVQYSDEKNSYLANGELISTEEARELLFNCRNLDEKDRKRLTA